TVVADALDEEIHALLRRPFAEVEFQRKDNPRAAVRAPEKCAHAILGRRDEFQIPEVEFPPERPALDPKRCVEKLAMLVRTLAPPSLEVMAGHEFVKDGGSCEVAVV